MSHDGARGPGNAPGEDTDLPRAPRDAVQRWRIAYRREASLPDAVAREPKAAWERALRSSGLPIAGLDAEPSRPKFSLAAQLANGVGGDRELVDVWLTVRLPRWQVREALETVLPAGHELVDVYDVWLREPSLPGQVVASVFRCSVTASIAPGVLADAIGSLLAADRLPRERTKGERTVSYDLRPFVASVASSPHGDGSTGITMVLRHDPERGIGRPEEVLAELTARTGVSAIGEAVSSLVRVRVVLAGDQEAGL